MAQEITWFEQKLTPGNRQIRRLCRMLRTRWYLCYQDRNAGRYEPFCRSVHVSFHDESKFADTTIWRYGDLISSYWTGLGRTLGYRRVKSTLYQRRAARVTTASNPRGIWWHRLSRKMVSKPQKNSDIFQLFMNISSGKKTVDLQKSTGYSFLT